jgi:biotin synthase
MMDLRTREARCSPPDHDRLLRHDWTRAEALALYEAPFNDLLFRAHTVHRRFFDANTIQQSRLLSIKTGGCAEDCGYCSQSAHHASGITASKLMALERVLDEAKRARDAGATRYCMGAAWRSPKTRDMDLLCAMVEGVRALGLETCMTLGMLSDDDVGRLKTAGLDYYNHNIDTSERYYSEIITTRTFADRLETLERVREAGIKVCAGGIVGMGEEREDRVDMLVTLANLPQHPESVPINMLIAVPGTPLAEAERIDPIAFVRTIALARILMPKSYVRLSAGRKDMSDETQALCFFAGANSIFVGDVLLTAENPGEDTDAALFAKLGLRPLEPDPCPADKDNVQNP